MEELPFRPSQAGYTAAFDDGVRTIRLDGGRPRTRRGTLGNATAVSASWMLLAGDYDAFMGFVRNWSRTGTPFLCRLLLDSSQIRLYETSFVPDSVRLVSVQGMLFTVSAELTVVPLPEYLNPDTDSGAALLNLLRIYGNFSSVMQVMRGFEVLTNEKLPHEI